MLAAVLALAACGTEVAEDPELSIGPTGPTEGESDRVLGTAERTSTAAPTPPAPTGSATGTTTTSGPAVPTSAEVEGADATTGTSSGPTATGASSATGGPATTSAGASPSVEPPATTSPPSTTTEATAGDAGTEDAPAALPGFVVDQTLHQEPTGATQLLVTDIRVGRQDGFDRVVLDLSGSGQVGWRVAYADAPAIDGSGTPVDLAGDQILQVSALGMTYPEPGDPTYDDLLLVDGGGLLAVTEILRGVPFEGQVQVYVGTGQRVPFRVFRLSDPERLVIDLQQPGR